MKQYFLLVITLSISKLFAQKNDLTLMETLKKTDTLGIYFSSIGTVNGICGVSVKNDIKIFYRNNALVAQTRINGKTVSANIDNAKRDFLIAVEKESYSYHDPNKVCDSSDGYWYYINRDFKFQIIDQTCMWHGFEKMTNRIFASE